MAPNSNLDIDIEKLIGEANLRNQPDEPELSPPPPITNELKELISSDFSEYNSLKERIEGIKREKEEKKQLMKKEEEMRLAEINKSTPENILKALYQVLRVPEIIKYLNEIGDIIVYQSDRGFGKSTIILTRIDTTDLKTNMEEKIKQRDKFEQNEKLYKGKTKDPDSIKEDMKEYNKINTDIEAIKKEILFRENKGGYVYLHLEKSNRHYLLDFNTKEKKEADNAFAMLQMYFGKNNIFEDSLIELNTPEKILIQIEKNFKIKNQFNRIVKLKEELKNSSYLS